MAATAVSVRIEVLSVECGIWCDTCNLATRVVVHYATTTGSQTTLRAKTTCEEHGND